MNAPLIAPGTRLGAVHLNVSDLRHSVAYYRDHIGLVARDAAGEENIARLHAGGRDLLVLHGRPDAPRAPRAAGLYHVAYRVPSRAALGATLVHLGASGTPLTGASDHGVSEAVYLPDPDDLGIEIYCDRPREAWPYMDGQLRMVNDELDVQGLIAEAPAAGAWAGLPAGSTVGHIHLHVGRIEDAERFYVGLLGFERVARLGDSALFVAAGGYHHHVGLNTWRGIGAPPPPAGAIGLDHFTIELPDEAERERVAGRLRAAGVKESVAPEGPAFEDPSTNRVALAVAG
jgi:catechol 2,3-dioxygenase